MAKRANIKMTSEQVLQLRGILVPTFYGMAGMCWIGAVALFFLLAQEPVGLMPFEQISVPSGYPDPFSFIRKVAFGIVALGLMLAVTAFVVNRRLCRVAIARSEFEDA